MGLFELFFGKQKEIVSPEPKAPIFKYGDIVEVWPEGATEYFGRGTVIDYSEEFAESCGYTFGLGIYYKVQYPLGHIVKIHASELKLTRNTGEYLN